MRYQILSAAATLLMHAAQPAPVHAQWGPTFPPYDYHYSHHHRHDNGFPWWIYQQPAPTPAAPVIIVIQPPPAAQPPLLPPTFDVLPAFTGYPASPNEQTYTGENTTPVTVARP